MSTYLWTSAELLAQGVGAVQIGLLETGKYSEVKAKMEEVAIEKRISRPLMVADLIFKEGKRSQLGSSGQPYPIAENEWETFVAQARDYCDETPKVYMVDGEKYAAPI